MPIPSAPFLRLYTTGYAVYDTVIVPPPPPTPPQGPLFFDQAQFGPTSLASGANAAFAVTAPFVAPKAGMININFLCFALPSGFVADLQDNVLDIQIEANLNGGGFNIISPGWDGSVLTPDGAGGNILQPKVTGSAMAKLGVSAADSVVFQARIANMPPNPPNTGSNTLDIINAVLFGRFDPFQP